MPHILNLQLQCGSALYWSNAHYVTFILLRLSPTDCASTYTESIFYDRLTNLFMFKHNCAQHIV